MNYKWFQTSEGTGDLSLTIKGILIGAIPLIILIGQQFGVEFTKDYLTQGIQLFSELLSVSIVAVGLFRKAINWIRNIKRK